MEDGRWKIGHVALENSFEQLLRFSMRAGDTTDDADALQIEVLRGMTGAQRFQLACEMSDAVRQIALAGVRSRHPEWSETELVRELMRQLYSPSELPPDLR